MYKRLKSYQIHFRIISFEKRKQRSIEKFVRLKHTSTLKHIRVLAALKRPILGRFIFIIHILASKLDYFTIKEWEGSHG